MIRINFGSYGEVEIQLDYQNAPNTCANFVSLVKAGFYQGLTMHRIIKGFMIQGGDPQGNGMGGPGYHIPGEFRQNHFPNQLRHERGVISMARSASFDSAGSQFFIMHKDAFYLDGAYAAFGKVTKGIEVIDRIANVKTTPSDRPLERIIIVSMEAIDEPTMDVKKLK